MGSPKQRIILALAIFGFGAAVQQGGERSRMETSPLARDLVMAHNLVRSKIGVPPLTWSGELEKTAQDWANRLIESGEFKHRSYNQFGENIYEISNGYATPYRVVDAWASEAKNYEYNANSCSEVCGHYTQVVWRDTKAVGCGVARDDKREIWVCNYAPFGNIVGERPY